MDLNASPQPADDSDHTLFNKQHIGQQFETAVEIGNRERQESHQPQSLKRKHSDEGRKCANQQGTRDQVHKMRNNRVYDSSKLPNGWLGCPESGEELYGFVPSKVPLSDAYNDYIPLGEKYSFEQVVRKQIARNRQIGLVIDFTNTDRYYPSSGWKNYGIKHVKISCKGHDSVPDNESVNIFFFEVSLFLSYQKQPKKYVLVHCTHGYNRTGFMIVHYLMRTQPLSVTQALKKFADARPPGIYKADYIDALYAFYHERRPESVSYPSTPEWKRCYDIDLNGEVVAVLDEDDDGGRVAPVQEIHEVDVMMTNDDVLGDGIHSEHQFLMQQFCYQTLEFEPRKQRRPFPGSHPVSLDRDHLQYLRQHYYYATWKADGTRYMMLINKDGCYLVDRNFNFRRVQMRFPCKHTSKGLGDKSHHFTLLDGEMIIDTVPHSRKQERRYLIYDMMAINGKSIVKMPFSERWEMVEKEVIEPRNYERRHINESTDPYYNYEMEPFRIRRKDFWPLSSVTKLLKEFIPKLSHDADGLIFQGWDDPYVPLAGEGKLLKWKYPEMNSVDFLFKVTSDHREQLYLNDKTTQKLMHGMKVLFKDPSDPSSYSGRIVECSWNSEEKVWVFMRVRTDKSTSNDVNTYYKIQVMKSIRDNITEDIILSELHEIVQLPMYTDRIKMDCKAHTNAARRR